MNVNKNSWHYKVYAWSYFHSYDVPWSTNLCQYTRRLVTFVPVKALVFGVVGIFVLLLEAAVLPFLLAIGLRPNRLLFFDAGYDQTVVEYDGLRIPGTKFRVLPWHVILGSLPIIGLVLLPVKLSLIIVATLLVIAAFGFGIFKLASNPPETLRLL